MPHVACKIYPHKAANPVPRNKHLPTAATSAPGAAFPHTVPFQRALKMRQSTGLRAAAVAVAALVASSSAQQVNFGTLQCGGIATGSTTGATHTTGHAAPEHWWNFTVPANMPATGSFTFSTCGSGFDTWVHIFNVAANGNRGSQVYSCDDCGPCGTRTVAVANLQRGARYMVAIDGWSTSNGAYRMQVTCPTTPTPPAPNPFGTANCGFVHTGNTQSGTHQVGNAAPEHWWMFEAPVAGSYTFDTCGSSYDTYLHIYVRTRGSNYVSRRIASCDDCGPCGTRTVLTATLAANTQYWVVTDGWSTRFGSYRLAVSCPAIPVQPAALQCGVVSTGNTGVGGSNVAGTGAAPDHWYRISVNVPGVYIFSSCGSNYDTWVHVFRASANSPTTNNLGPQVSTCDDCGPCGTRTVLQTTLTVGNYFVVMDGWASSRGTYRLELTCPSITIRGDAVCNQRINGNTAQGTNTVGNNAPENWWRFRAPATRAYTFNTCGSGYDTWLHIYNRTGLAHVGPQISTCDDCGPCGNRIVLTTTLSAGDYWVVMDGWSTSRGAYQLTIDCGPPLIIGDLTCSSTPTTGDTTATGAFNSVGHAAPENWWRFIAGSTGMYTFNSCGSAYDTWVHVYRAATQTVVGPQVSTCDDCGPCGTRTVLTVQLTRGYYFVVMDGYSTSGGAYSLQATCANDGRTVLGNAVCGQTITGTTATGSTHTVGQAAPENWWTFSAPQSRVYIFNSCGSNFDTYVHVYRRTGASVGSRVATCDDCGPCGTRTVLQTYLDAGDYWLVMDGYANSNGTYSLGVQCDLAPPSVEATLTCGVPGNRATGSTTGGSSTVGHAAPDHWFAFTAPMAGNVTYTFDTCGSSYDTFVHVYGRVSGTAGGVGAEMASCDDCGPCGLRTVLTANLVPGDYYVVIDGFGSAQGQYTLGVTCQGYTESPTFAPTSAPTLHPCTPGETSGCDATSTFCAVQSTDTSVPALNGRPVLGGAAGRYTCQCRMGNGFTVPDTAGTSCATPAPTLNPTPFPTFAPVTPPPTFMPTPFPTMQPTLHPTMAPTNAPVDSQSSRGSDDGTDMSTIWIVVAIAAGLIVIVAVAVYVRRGSGDDKAEPDPRQAFANPTYVEGSAPAKSNPAFEAQKQGGDGYLDVGATQEDLYEDGEGDF